MDRVLLIDGHNAMWRACVSFGPPIAHELCAGPWHDAIKCPIEPHCKCRSPWDTISNQCYGEKFVFVYNFFRNLRPLIEDCAPDKCFFVLEGYPRFRYELYGDYKANRIIKTASRQEDNEKFNRAKDIILPLLKFLPITIARAADYEADDVVATLCNNMREEDLTIISNDSDYIQLLQGGYPHLQVYNPIKKVCMEAPSYPYVAWKCLNGDKSDNIPKLLSPKKSIQTVSDPDLFQKFLSVEENRANFQINRQLIEFRIVPDEELIMEDGVRNFPILKMAFNTMKFESIINDKSWEKYTKTFDCIRF